MVDPNISPLIIGGFIANLLMGVNILQAYQYFRRFPDDRMMFKALVAIIMIILLFNESLVVYATHQAALIPFFFFSAPWSLTMRPMLTGFTSTLVQLFFGRIFWLLSATTMKQSDRWRYPLLILIGGFSLLSFAGSVCTTALGFKYGFELEHLNFLIGSATVWIVSSVCSDLMISLSINYYLRAESPSSTNSDLISTLQKNLFLNNSLTLIISVIDMIIYLSLPKTSWYDVALGAVSQIYALSLLISLNARKKLERNHNDAIQRQNDELRTAVIEKERRNTNNQIPRKSSLFGELDRSISSATVFDRKATISSLATKYTP